MSEWRPIPGCEAYEVSRDGRIRRGEREMKLALDRHGYVKVSLSLGKKGSYRTAQVHRLMCEAFFKPPPSPAHQAAHWNGVRADNRIENLRWATPRENAEDRARHGIHAPRKGSSHHAARLTEACVAEMKRRHALGARGCDLAAEFRVSRATVSGVLSGKAWRHVA